ncbi:6-hydroxymethylpterin diphosphokinase MptE-like protein [Glaciecola sp. SC05]|uniref:motility associated factor glycosyltransferase family protein n=1 Tax=Glaciecola sp. SC05 TaxID=1987355 RepID=UPI003528622A
MHNDIRLHLANNEKQQSDIESQLATALQQRFEANIKAFARHIPSLAEKLQQKPLSSTSIFVDKNSQTNIVDVRSGKSFYHFNVDDEINKQCDNLAAHCALVDMPGNSQKSVNRIKTFSEFAAFSQQLNARLAEPKVDALVIFGIGKGHHIPLLLDKVDSENVVIYEPSWERFFCSLYCTDWYVILEQAAQHSRRLFLQIEQNAASLHQDLNELVSAFDVRRILFYKHYNEASFDIVMQELRAGNTSVLKHPCPEGHEHGFQHWVPAWTPSLVLSDWQELSTNSETYIKNFAAFERYFPNIHQKFADYQALVWQAIVHRHSGQVNLFNINTCTIHTIEDVTLHAQAIAAHCRRYPNQDGLIFGYESDKLKHYLHNTFIRRANTILINQKDEKGELPEHIKSLILFGLEAGYTFEALLESTQIDNLFICEPNPDFFYASLFAIDWAGILKSIDDSESRLYLNVGEAGSALFTDINSQFLAAGPHLLADTYFFQTYENEALARVIRDVRDQLKITFSLSENLDHAMYGIAHTKYALHHKIPAMAANAPSLISKHVRQLPLFIVGNGPSLDNNIQIVKEYREQILVVSCGTALQALHSYGITPDFHAEVEQCRATFDWASRINDPDYLKAITLVSVNGIHPDTCNIYKEALFGFKLGESSSSSALSIFGSERFSILKKAYPTVTNLAVNFFLELGFTNLYLLGVDLGFVDYNKHHSAQSGYFENGKQIYDYQDNLAKSLPVKGNFRERVYTKAEFNISRQMMEQVLSNFKADCYNLSDGVFIEGTTPLYDDDVLIANSIIDRQACLIDIKNAFLVIDADVCELYKQAFSQRILNQEMDKLRAICRQDLSSKDDVEALVASCRELVTDNIIKGKSLFIYYFYGSLNNLCATLSKALMSQSESQSLVHAEQILSYWWRLLEDAKLMANQDDFLFDTSSSFSEKREAPRLTKSHIPCVVYNPDFAEYLADAEDKRINIAQSIPKLSAGMKSIVFITCLADMQQFKSEWRGCTKSQHSFSLLVVYTDARLYKCIQKELSQVLPECACLVYVPLWVPPIKLHNVAQGIEPLTDRHEGIQFLIARLDDASRFMHIVFRSRFDETGLIRAYTNKEDEYSSDAADYLATNLGPLLSVKYAYSFKRYIGFVECSKPEPTMLDALDNRGLYIPRAMEPYELLGEWYKTQQAIEIRSHLQEHVQSV